MGLQRSGSLALFVAGALTLLPLAAAADGVEAPQGSSTLLGKLTAEATKGPVANAVVVAYHLSTGGVARSTATGPDGRYEMTGLAHGYYDLAVESAAGLFVVNQVVNLPPSGKAVANLHLGAPAPEGEGPRDFPGSEQPPAGVAALVQKSSKKGVKWGTGAGIVTTLLLVAAGGSSGGTSSPSTPP